MSGEAATAGRLDPEVYQPIGDCLSAVEVEFSAPVFADGHEFHAFYFGELMCDREVQTDISIGRAFEEEEESLQLHKFDTNSFTAAARAAVLLSMSRPCSSRCTNEFLFRTPVTPG
jgi:hypothetical protein